jgi:hypothetical protein
VQFVDGYAIPNNHPGWGFNFKDEFLKPI